MTGQTPMLTATWSSDCTVNPAAQPAAKLRHGASRSRATTRQAASTSKAVTFKAVTFPPTKMRERDDLYRALDRIMEGASKNGPIPVTSCWLLDIDVTNCGRGDYEKCTPVGIDVAAAKLTKCESVLTRDG